MQRTRFKFLLAAALAACFCAAVSLGASWEAKLAGPAGPDLLRAQSSGDEEEDQDDEAEEKQERSEEREFTSSSSRNEAGVAQRIYREGKALKAQYHFINFNRDRLTVNFGMDDGEFARYAAGYGYTDAEMNALRAWRESARQEAWNSGWQKGGKPAAEKAIADVGLEYDTRLRTLLRSRGMALMPGNVVQCDMPLIVKRNVALMKPLALAFQQIGTSRRYSEEDLLGAVLSLVQTAVRYKIPPPVVNGLHTGGLLPPGKVLLSGWGDCDTKTGVLASILGNWNGVRMVGIAVPGHYLMAIRRLPAKGDVFVRYEGLEYVLVEPAGPAWLEPGTIGQATTALLSGAEGYKVDPFF